MKINNNLNHNEEETEDKWEDNKEDKDTDKDTERENTTTDNSKEITDNKDSKDSNTITSDSTTTEKRAETLEIKTINMITKGINQEETIEMEDIKQKNTTIKGDINKITDKGTTIKMRKLIQELEDSPKIIKDSTKVISKVENKLMHLKEATSLISSLLKWKNKKVMKRKFLLTSTEENLSVKLQGFQETPGKGLKEEEAHRWISVRKRWGSSIDYKKSQRFWKHNSLPSKTSSKDNNNNFQQRRVKVKEKEEE